LANAALEQVRHLEVSARETRALATATQGALELAHINFIKEQRPYVWLRDIGGYELNPGHQVRWGFVYGNFGKSPAIDLRTRSQIVFGQEKEKRIAPNLFQPFQRQGQQKAGSVIFPGDVDVYSTALSQEVLTEDDLVYIMETDAGIMRLIYIEYFDTSGNSYSTEVCHMRFRTGAIAACDQHNKIR
jgi:hypothetical protein